MGTVKGKRYTPEQIIAEWVRQGGTVKGGKIAAAISTREGNRQLKSENVNTNNTVDRGPFQINSIWGKWSQQADDNLAKAVAAARHVKKLQGWKAWTVYNTGSWKTALPNIKVGKLDTSTNERSPINTKLVNTGTKTDTQAAIMAALARHAKSPGSSLAKLVLDRIGSGQYDVATHQRVRVPGVQAGTNPTSRGSRATVTASPGSRRGQYVVAPSANRAGAKLAGELTHFLSLVAGNLGDTIQVGTGTNHDRMTVNGNVSDHWDGHAADIPANANTTEGRRHGDAIAYSAFRAAGVPDKKARLWAKNGGLYNVTYKGHRVQIIWKTNEGGNHFTHVHIGIR